MKCPICAEEMTTDTRYDVEVDVCLQHGIWLDKGELNKIADTAADRAPRWIAAPSGDDRRQGRLEGMFLGWLSLFLPK